jgi:hypothetical protein
MQNVVTVEFAVMLGAEGQVTVSPLGEVVDDNDMTPAKLLILVRETEMDPSLPELMFVGETLMAKSPTWTIDLASWEAVPGAPLPVTVIR